MTIQYDIEAQRQIGEIFKYGKRSSVFLLL